MPHLDQREDKLTDEFFLDGFYRHDLVNEFVDLAATWEDTPGIPEQDELCAQFAKSYPELLPEAQAYAPMGIRGFWLPSGTPLGNLQSIAYALAYAYRQRATNKTPKDTPNDTQQNTTAHRL